MILGHDCGSNTVISIVVISVYDPCAVGGVNSRFSNCLRENSVYLSRLVRVSFVLEIK